MLCYDAKKFVKKFKKSLRVEKFYLSLHPLSLLNGVSAAEVLRKIFLKKVAKKFGSFENKIYLCTRFSLLTKKGDKAY